MTTACHLKKTYTYKTTTSVGNVLSKSIDKSFLLPLFLADWYVLSQIVSCKEGKQSAFLKHHMAPQLTPNLTQTDTITARSRRSHALSHAANGQTDSTQTHTKFTRSVFSFDSVQHNFFDSSAFSFIDIDRQGKSLSAPVGDMHCNLPTWTH